MPLFKNYLGRPSPGSRGSKQRVAAESDATRKAALQVQLRAAENNVAAQEELQARRRQT